jgi:hypothetical protein
MIANDSIRSVQDLKGKLIASISKNSHAGLNVWPFMRQEGLDLDKGDYDLVETHASTERCPHRRVRRRFCGPTAQSARQKRRSAGDHGVADAHDPRRDADRRNVL